MRAATFLFSLVRSCLCGSQPVCVHVVGARAMASPVPSAPSQLGTLCVTRHARSQATILEGARHADCGSSACSKIAAHCALNAICLGAFPMNVQQLTKGVSNCVRAWDLHGACNGGHSGETVLREAERHKKTSAASCQGRVRQSDDSCCHVRAVRGSL